MSKPLHKPVIKTSQLSFLLNLVRKKLNPKLSLFSQPTNTNFMFDLRNMLASQ